MRRACHLGQAVSEQCACIKTYYCLRQAVGNDLIFEVEVIDPKDEQRYIQEEDSKVKGWVLNDWGVDKRTV